jgi:hypothetical protein
VRFAYRCYTSDQGLSLLGRGGYTADEAESEFVLVVSSSMREIEHIPLGRVKPVHLSLPPLCQS